LICMLRIATKDGPVVVSDLYGSLHLE
jgi:hypothetical protein